MHIRTVIAIAALALTLPAAAQVDVKILLQQSEAFTMTFVNHEVRRLTKLEMTVYPNVNGTTSSATWDTWAWQAGPATSVSPPLGDNDDGQRSQMITLTTLAEQGKEMLAVGDIDSPSGITQLKVRIVWENGVTAESWLARIASSNSWEAELSPFEELAEVPPGPPAEQVYLSWVPPTENEDGTPYTDPGGYKVYIGTVSHVYFAMLPEISPAKNYMFVQGLVPSVKYYFATTAVSATHTESIFSNEVEYTPVVATNDPVAPSSMKASGVTTIEFAYTISTVQNAMVKQYVGTVARGTTCDPNQKINVWGEQADDMVDLYLVPLGTPGLELLPGVSPDVVYARCEAP
jgi:hypothetical protein